jgi:hypothetical protein
MRQIRLLLLAFIAPIALVAFVQQVNPNDVVRQISEMRRAKVEEARGAGRAPDSREIQREAASIAKAAVSGVDISKIDPKDGFAWAQLFQMASDHRNACEAASRFVRTGPDAQQKFGAQMLMLTSCNELGDGRELLDILRQIWPPNSTAAISVASSTTGMYADTIKNSIGLDAALRALDIAERLVPLDEFLSDQDKKRAESLRARLRGKRNLYTLAGKPAPELVADRTIGEYNGLAGYKGKIVLLKFYAHW